MSNEVWSDDYEWCGRKQLWSTLWYDLGFHFWLLEKCQDSCYQCVNPPGTIHHLERNDMTCALTHSCNNFGNNSLIFMKIQKLCHRTPSFLMAVHIPELTAQIQKLCYWRPLCNCLYLPQAKHPTFRKIYKSMQLEEMYFNPFTAGFSFIYLWFI